MSNYRIRRTGDEEYLQHWSLGGAHKYIAKIDLGGKFRYFYSQAEIDAYKNALKNAGNAIGDAAKNTYKVVRKGMDDAGRQISTWKRKAEKAIGLTDRKIANNAYKRAEETKAKYGKNPAFEGKKGGDPRVRTAEKIAANMHNRYEKTPLGKAEDAYNTVKSMGKEISKKISKIGKTDYTSGGKIATSEPWEKKPTSSKKTTKENKTPPVGSATNPKYSSQTEWKKATGRQQNPVESGRASTAPKYDPKEVRRQKVSEAINSRNLIKAAPSKSTKEPQYNSKNRSADPNQRPYAYQPKQKTSEQQKSAKAKTGMYEAATASKYDRAVTGSTRVQRKARAKALKNSGKSYAQIAKQLGVSVSYVSSLLNS